MNNFYNTTNETGETLKNSNQKAETQEETIMNIFRNEPEGLYTPSEIHKISGLNCPLTSIRRAISNLCSNGFLVKTTTMKMGTYGKLVHCYTTQKEEPYIVFGL